jgi:hypothetical protein
MLISRFVVAFIVHFTFIYLIIHLFIIVIINNDEVDCFNEEVLNFIALMIRISFHE